MKTKSLSAAILLLFCTTCLWASNTSVDGIWYDFDNSTQTASVTYRGTMPSDYKDRYQGEVVIPASVTYSGKTYRVTSIGYAAFSQCRSLTSVTIPNSVTNIGRYAFDNCDALASISLPNSVTGIEEGAFARCIGLTSITIPNSVKNIGNYAFMECSGLSSIIVDSDNTIYDSRDNCNAIIQTGTSTLLFGCKNTIIPNSVTSIGGYAFYGCTGLTSVTIPNSVSSIGGYAFHGCTGLTSVTIPNSATSVWDGAFSGCSGLASITIPNSVISIGNEAFAYCTGLTGITIGNDVSYIGNHAFEHCSSLTSIIWNAKNYTSEVGTSGLFYDIRSQIISFEIGNDVVIIPPYLCSGMSRLTSVTIPNSVTSIGKGAFTNVPNIIYSGSAEGSPWGARCVNGYVDGWMIFSDEAKTNLVTCSRSARDNMIIPNGVISIGVGAFELCSDITSVTIPNSVTSIGRGAFSGCNGLTSVTIPNSVTDFGNSAFSRCTGLTSVTINCSAGIGSSAFQGCSSLSTLTFGNNYTIIKNNNAFSGCSNLKNILYGSSVKVIEENTFIGCKKIETITCYSMRPPTVNDGAFENLPYSTIVYVPADYLNTYKMHDFWGVFDVRPLGATSVQITDLQITPNDNTAEVVWPTVENAATYEMIIKDKNGLIVCTLIFNANGQLTSIAFAAPGRSPASTQSAGFSFTVTGLDSGTLYDLTITAKDNSGNVLKSTTKSFATNGYTAIDNVESSAKFGGQKILHNGHLLILRDGKTYTVHGQEVR